MGLTNGFGSVAGIFVPLVKEKIVGSPTTCVDLIHRLAISLFASNIYFLKTQVENHVCHPCSNLWGGGNPLCNLCQWGGSGV